MSIKNMQWSGMFFYDINMSPMFLFTNLIYKTLWEYRFIQDDAGLVGLVILPEQGTYHNVVMSRWIINICFTLLTQTAQLFPSIVGTPRNRRIFRKGRSRPRKPAPPRGSIQKIP